MSWLKPIVFENNKFPVWVSYISPIEVNAINIGPFIFCRGELSRETLQHETIHFKQQLELLFVFQWILYGLFYVIGRITQGSWKMAYYSNPFEVEAYENESVPGYLNKRKFLAWTKHLGELKG